MKLWMLRGFRNAVNHSSSRRLSRELAESYFSCRWVHCILLLLNSFLGNGHQWRWRSSTNAWYQQRLDFVGIHRYPNATLQNRLFHFGCMFIQRRIIHLCNSCSDPLKMQSFDVWLCKQSPKQLAIARLQEILLPRVCFPHFPHSGWI